MSGLHVNEPGAETSAFSENLILSGAAGALHRVGFFLSSYKLT